MNQRTLVDAGALVGSLILDQVVDILLSGLSRNLNAVGGYKRNLTGIPGNLADTGVFRARYSMPVP
jgi:hypothetical protein